MYKKKFTFSILIFLSLIFFIKVYAEEKINTNDVIIGNTNSSVKIIVFSSLTCPHCASFHMEVLPKIIKAYVDNNKAYIVLKDFPLDLAALNAAKLIRCGSKKNQLQILDYIYDNQIKWAVGEDIEKINENLFKIADIFNINNEQTKKCFENQEIEDYILNSRINAHKKYKINSTPTVIINEKKIEENDFKSINKILKKIT